MLYSIHGIQYYIVMYYNNHITDTFYTRYTYHTNAGSGNCKTIMNPIATSISPRFINAIKQHIPLVFGQNWNKYEN